eukprot:scaffold1637_cov410-Prasinococcus_capsulatus_cf.AAC.5
MPRSPPSALRRSKLGDPPVYAAKHPPRQPRVVHRAQPGAPNPAPSARARSGAEGTPPHSGVGHPQSPGVMDRQAVRALACKGGLEGAVETRCVSRSLRTFPAAHFCPASVRREQCAYPTMYDSCTKPTTNPMTGGTITLGSLTWTLQLASNSQTVTQYSPGET